MRIAIDRQMEFLKKNKFILLGVLLVAGLVLARNMGSRHFRYDAKRYAEPSVTNSNTLTSSKISSLDGDALLVILSDDPAPEIKFRGMTISVKADSVFSEAGIRQIRKNKGPVILYSPDCSVSSRVWMALAQTGVKDLYIYLSDPENEVLKK